MAARGTSPGPNNYEPLLLRSGKTISFGQSPKLYDKQFLNELAKPGPGSYDTNEIVEPGLSKTFGGGKLRESKPEASFVPGPGQYF